MTDAVDDETFRDLLDVLRRFIAERLVPLEQEVEDNDAVPEPIIADMREMGLFGLSIPVAYGGLDLDVVQETEISLLFGETSSAFRLVFMPNVGLGSRAIAISGTAAQKDTYLPGLASGEWRACFCLTEPEAGSDAVRLKTTARAVDGGFILNGTKRFISNAPRANLFIVMARTGDAGLGADAISAFIVERGTPGLSVGKPESKLGQRGAPIADVIFEDLFVPTEALIGGRVGLGFRTAMQVIDSARISVAASAVGMARRMIDEAARYALQRKQFGQPIAEFQLVQALLADSETDYLASHALTLRAAETLRDGGDARNLAAAAKYFASEALSRIADRTLQVFGGAGYTKDYCIERFYRDSRALRIYDGTSQILQLAIARRMLKNHQ